MFFDCNWIKSIHKSRLRDVHGTQWLLRAVPMIFLFQRVPTPRCMLAHTQPDPYHAGAKLSEHFTRESCRFSFFVSVSPSMLLHKRRWSFTFESIMSRKHHQGALIAQPESM